MRSPTETSMSYSRACGFGEISYASRMRSSVESPIAERTPTTRKPDSRAATRRRATSLIFSVSPTDVPPNFMTMRSRPRAAASAATSGTASYCVVVTENSVGLHLAAARERAPERHFVCVLEIAADRQAARESCHAHSAAQTVGEVRRGRFAGHVRVRCEHDFLHAVALDAVHELVDAQMCGLDTVEGRQRAAEHVVQAAVLRRPLDRDEVDGLLDDADDRVVAALVTTDRADLLLGEVAALVAEAHTLLYVVDRVGERLRLLLRHLEEMERESLPGPASDAGQARQLRDEIVDGGAQHRRSVAVRFGRLSA